ncbi:DUF1788 domain-containing protein [Methanoplanus limicola]|uniref:Cytoplasmic protein n=1 Tax=Methanoplanus limicola DSM 2279 TaxID=937775 RepID=H1Z3P8_9EURY|nr:DUF1788 domain-containing protein [Methanoplanus limicola]EHQ35647.1 protein of unknown function DUF1788 [Methanoplanus limicola DSM 2279]
MNIESRIELLKKEIIKDDFLQGRGLGNEVPFWIFDYPPESELLIRHSMEKIGDILDNNSIGYIEIDLYEMCLETINKKIRPEKLIDFEAKKGSDELLKKLKIILKPDTVKQILKERIESDGNVKIIFLTGIGKAWPLIRSHSILNNLQPVTGNIPLVAFYPGEYRNYELSLFGRFKDANYYRAFRMINENTA